MPLRQLKRITVLTGLVIAALAAATALYGAVRIGGWSFAANGQVARDRQYTGGCPVDLKFDWGVISTGPSEITYWTSRNDGARSSPKSIRHPGGGRSIPIVEEWHLGANNGRFANYPGWMEIHIEGTAPATNRIGFTLHCR